MRALLLACLVVGAAGCGDASVDFLNADSATPDPAKVVGAACATAAECAAGSLCLRGEEFPSGSCALPCQLATVCPSATLCVELDDSAGYPVASACLPSCADQADCVLGYECRSAQQLGTQIEVQICSN